MLLAAGKPRRLRQSPERSGMIGGTMKLASILALALLSISCSNPFKEIAEYRDPGMPEELKKHAPRPRFYCLDDQVPGDLPVCESFDLSTVQIVPQPQSATVACRIMHEIRPNNQCCFHAQLGSVDRDGTVHWWWNQRYLNSHVQDKMRQACTAAVLNGGDKK